MSGLTSSSLGRKVAMSLSGFFLITFLLVHLGVNLTLFVGAETFNAASHFMATNPLIQVMQYVLAAGFIFHIAMGIKLELKNRASRPIKYAKNNAAANSGWASRNMIITGILVLLFIVIHLKDFFVKIKFGEVHDDYLLVVELFKNPIYVLIYVIAFVLLGIHLSHGFQSAFTSVGARAPKYLKCVKNVGMAFSYFIALGFSVIAIYFYFA
ncbi:MAG: succinate dehydrogenase cytochrome b subunit [Flavobacteriaceae bacterium]|nr:succinate dehydrogenase cytochrome b subunit [Flavobacteriaceae bacterium]